METVPVPEKISRLFAAFTKLFPIDWGWGIPVFPDDVAKLYNQLDPGATKAPKDIPWPTIEECIEKAREHNLDALYRPFDSHIITRREDIQISLTLSKQRGAEGEVNVGVYIEEREFGLTYLQLVYLQPLGSEDLVCYPYRHKQIGEIEGIQRIFSTIKMIDRVIADNAIQRQCDLWSPTPFTFSPQLGLMDSPHICP